MNTLAVVEQVLMETSEPMTVKQIVQLAGARLPSKSRTPETVVARDLSMDLKRLGEQSRFIRTAPGLYALRTSIPKPLSSEIGIAQSQSQSAVSGTTDLISAALRQERTALPLTSASGQIARPSTHDQEMVS
jgi:hypothetical protein